jgi:hypothetical protein
MSSQEARALIADLIEDMTVHADRKTTSLAESRRANNWAARLETIRTVLTALLGERGAQPDDQGLLGNTASDGEPRPPSTSRPSGG